MKERVLSIANIPIKEKINPQNNKKITYNFSTKNNLIIFAL
jgi:hypothetical protein